MISQDVGFELLFPGMCSVVHGPVNRQWLWDGEIDKTDEYRDDPNAEVELEALRERLAAARAPAEAEDGEEGAGAKKRGKNAGSELAMAGSSLADTFAV